MNENFKRGKQCGFGLQTLQGRNIQETRSQENQTVNDWQDVQKRKNKIENINYKTL